MPKHLNVFILNGQTIQSLALTVGVNGELDGFAEDALGADVHIDGGETEIVSRVIDSGIG